jgi:hypothetical protein
MAETLASVERSVAASAITVPGGKIAARRRA